MRKYVKCGCALLLLSSFILLSPIVNAQKIESLCPLIFTMHKNNGTEALYYNSNHPLSMLDPDIKTLLIYVHGINRNCPDYFDYAENMLTSANQDNTTLLIAPQYVNEEDANANQLSNDVLYWKKNEWKDGHVSISDSNHPQNTKMSSYEVLDSLITSVLTSNNFPNIKMVVIAGHSAGGQFVQRYSATTPIPNSLSKVKFRFIVMDPSSYMYLDAKRPAGNNTFAIPDSSTCPDYDKYPKGLNDLNSYAKAMGASNIRHNVLHRDIIILLGGKDTKTDSPNLDTSCEGNLEGAYRLERGLNYIAYLRTFPEYGNKENYSIVSDSGHDGDKMINSAEARKWIFGK